MGKKKVLLIILDGWGLSPITEGNATVLAKTPVLDYLYSSYPHISISASGLEVGLNRGEMGNSEVGHLNLGTGRVVWENLPRIDYAIENDSFRSNEALQNCLNSAKETRLHLIGLVSSGGVHSHMRHIVALLQAAKAANVKNVCIHFISDGRDTPPQVAANFAKELEGEIKKIGVGEIVSLVGRYFAMDRDKHWERTQKAYDLFVNGLGTVSKNIFEAIENSYQNGKTDEFIEPTIIDPEKTVRPEDAIIFYNFREDRMRQIVESFVTENFNNFTIQEGMKPQVISMIQYESSYQIPVIFPPVKMKSTLADVLETYDLLQYHIAETEKYAHVTYFFNGGREELHRNEMQILVQSPRVATYDLVPEMSSAGVSDKICAALDKSADFIVVNYANGDMVGHTGKLDAAIAACESIDRCLAQVLAKASELGYNVIVTADHGNCEIMIDPMTHQPSTEHTTSPVPFVYMDFQAKPFETSANYSFSEQDMIAYAAEPYRGVLSDVSTTVLALLGMEKSEEMEGINLLDAL